MSKVIPAKKADSWPYDTDYTFDIECYPNLFTLAAEHLQTGTKYFFEISEWFDQREQLQSWLYYLSTKRCRMIGYNNMQYDYSMVHVFFMSMPHWSMLNRLQVCGELYKASQMLFRQPGEIEDVYRRRIYSIMPKESDRIIEQIDLYRIYHFDNQAKAVSLKVLEINMRSDDVVELPIAPGTWLTWDQRCKLVVYNVKDTVETTAFAMYSLPEIQLRERLTQKFGINMMCHNEGKIGEDIIRKRLVDAGIILKRGGTPRDKIKLSEIIFPYIKFNRPEFQQIHQFLLGQTITSTKYGGADDEADTEKAGYPCAMVDGFPWQFGKGGMHGSVESTIVRADETSIIIDVDVESFYPRLGQVNNIYPAHLGPQFCVEYKGVFDMRKEYPKSTHPMENLAFKYALNVPYGKSNSKYSFIYDPQYTMSITINGQLLLCMLGEWLLTIPGLSMIQANTDGITFKVPRCYEDRVKEICKAWEQYTCLNLEFAYYQAMYIRDVNNYIAHYVPDEKNPQGKRKLKGVYAHEEIPWHKDHSSVIIARAVEHFFIFGTDVLDTITSCRDPFDFMIKAKVPRNSQLWLEDDTGRRQQLQNTTRYYVAVNGGKLVKVMPPTDAMIEHWHTGTHYIRERDGDYKVVKPGGRRPAKTYTEVPKPGPQPPHREIGLQVGWQVADCARAADFDWSNLNYAYYVAEAKKLIDPLLSSG